ncbi:hypothetical protein GW932_03925 [archaeon]|nr:hypothetical protein [archaeon]
MITSLLNVNNWLKDKVKELLQLPLQEKILFITAFIAANLSGFYLYNNLAFTQGVYVCALLFSNLLIMHITTNQNIKNRMGKNV